MQEAVMLAAKRGNAHNIQSMLEWFKSYMNMKQCKNNDKSIEQRIAEYGGWVISNFKIQFMFKALN